MLILILLLSFLQLCAAVKPLDAADDSLLVARGAASLLQSDR